MADRERRQVEHSDRRQDSLRGGRRSIDKIACPHCGCLQSSVLAKHATLAQQLHVGYWRRRQCGGCLREFPTQEIARPDVS